MYRTLHARNKSKSSEPSAAKLNGTHAVRWLKKWPLEQAKGGSWCLDLLCDEFIKEELGIYLHCLAFGIRWHYGSVTKDSAATTYPDLHGKRNKTTRVEEFVYTGWPARRRLWRLLSGPPTELILRRLYCLAWLWWREERRDTPFCYLVSFSLFFFSFYFFFFFWQMFYFTVDDKSLLMPSDWGYTLYQTFSGHWKGCGRRRIFLLRM